MMTHIGPTWLWIMLLPVLAPCGLLAQSAAEQELARFEFTQPQMGVAFRIVLYAASESVANDAAEAAFHRIRDLNAVLSDYDPDSELSLLSRTSGKDEEVPVSSDLWFVLERAQTLAQQTGGAFDITVGPCVNLWRKARRTKQFPDPGLLAKARRAVGYQNLRLRPEGKSARLLVPDMRLDLGGIAKGYAVDAAQKVLRSRGITRALVGGDGDIGVSEPPPGKSGWRIAIAPLDVSNAPTNQYVLLKHAAISTSGDLSQRLEIDGRRYSHIVDPRTGIGLTDHSLVSIIAPDSITADSLATAVSVLGPEEGLKLIAQTKGTEVRIVRQPDQQVELYETRGFRKYYDAK